MDWFNTYREKLRTEKKESFNKLYEADILDDELQRYQSEDEKSLGDMINGSGKLVSSEPPTVQGTNVNWYITVKDTKQIELKLFFSTEDVKGINTLEYLFTEDSFALYRQLLQFKEIWEETWKTRLAQ